MIAATNEQDDSPGERDAHDQAQWQDLLAHQVKDRLALQQQHQQEEALAYLFEINLGERAGLVARQQAESKVLLQQQRAGRIALRKGQTP